MTQPTTPAPAMIFGLHYFCDHRCWRCSAASRCEVSANLSRQVTPAIFATMPPGARVASVLAASLDVTIQEAIMLAAADANEADAAPVPDASAARQFAAMTGPGASDTATAAAAAMRGRLFRAESDPLVQAGADYARTAMAFAPTLPPSDTRDRIEETACTVASKLFRAVTSGDDNDPADPQSDANGSAKVALLVIAESREAWAALGGTAFVTALDALAVEVRVRFPLALQFVRPGFDTTLVQ